MKRAKNKGEHTTFTAQGSFDDLLAYGEIRLKKERKNRFHNN